MSRETQLIFIRHGQHETSGVDNPHPSGLTELGRDEARTIGQKLTVQPERIRAFSVNNARSLATVALALYPETDDSSIQQRIDALRAEKRLTVKASLGYAPIADPRFEEELSMAFYQSRNLEFLVAYTDDYRLSKGDPISSYSSIAYDMASLVKERHSGNLINLAQGETADDEHELYCAREFSYACFRAKLEEVINGIDERDRFVEWYGKNVEWLPEARQDVVPIKVTTDASGLSRVTLNDRYGKLEFGIDDIEKIIQDYQAKFLAQQHEGE